MHAVREVWDSALRRLIPEWLAMKTKQGNGSRFGIFFSEIFLVGNAKLSRKKFPLWLEISFYLKLSFFLLLPQDFILQLDWA